MRPGAILAITFTEQGRRRAARAGAPALRRARPPRRGARDRGRVGLDDPRLLRAACCAPTRSRPGLDPAFTVLDEAAARAAARPRLGRGAGAVPRRPSAAPRRSTSSPPTTPTGCARRSRPSHDALRSAGQTRPRCRARRARRPARAAGRCWQRGAAAPRRARAGRATAARSRAARARARALRRAAARDAEPRRARARRRSRASASARRQGAEDRRPASATAARSTRYATACRDRARGRGRRAARRAARPYADAYADGQARARGAWTSTTSSCSPATCSTREPALRRSYAERFDRVMVDEFQDSNPLPARAVRGARPRRPVRRRRRAAVDLRLPSRRRRRLPRAPRRARRRRPRRDAGDELPQPRGAILDDDQRGLRAALRARTSSRCARAASREPAPDEPLVELLLTDQAGWDAGGHRRSASCRRRAGLAPGRGAAARPARARPRRRGRGAARGRRRPAARARRPARLRARARGPGAADALGRRPRLLGPPGRARPLRLAGGARQPA